MKQNNKCIKLLSLLFLTVMGSVSIQAQINNQANIKCPGGVNVNSYNGNLNLSRNDLFIKGRRLNFNISFYYNSIECRKNQGFGNGWQFQYSRQYKADSTGINVISSDGRVDHFSGDTSSNRFTAPKGVFDSLIRPQSGSYVLITKSKMKYFFNDVQHKRMTRLEEANGNFLNFTYTDSLLTQISDGAGRSIQLSYTNGKLAQVTDANGSPLRTIKYSYDTNGNLTQVTDPAGNKTKYGSIINGPINTITDKNGNTVDVIYQSNFGVKEVISCITDQRFSYNSATHTTHIVDAVESGNQVTVIQYDANGNVIKKTGNCCGFNVAYAYDKNNKVSKFTNANGDSYEYTYDANGNLLTKKDPLGNASNYTYDPVFSRLLSYKDKNGNITSLTYDGNGNLLQISFPMSVNNYYTYASNGDMITAVDGNGNTTTYSYDNYGNRIAIHQPLGVNHLFAYNSKCQLTAYTDPKGNLSTCQFDVLDRMTTVTDALNQTITLSYDASGNVLSCVDKNNHTSTFGYDALSRLTVFTDALNHSWYSTYDAKSNKLVSTDANGNRRQYAFDNLNRLISQTTPTNDISTFNYDAAGNLIAITLPNGNTVNITYDKLKRRTNFSDNFGTVYSFTYDNVSNLLSVSDGNGNTNNYTYDALDRRIGKTDALGNSATRVYDNNYNLISTKNFDNKLRTFSYDALNRRTNITGTQGTIASLIYDLDGNLISLSDANNNATTYNYDAISRTTQVTYPDATLSTLSYDDVGNITSVTDPNSVVTNYEYDASNKMILRDYPGSNDDVFTYDANGRILTAVNNDATVTFGYDAANRIVSESLNGKTTAYVYDVASNKHTTIYPGGRIISRVFDSRNRLSEIIEGSSTICSFSYDNANRLIKRNINANGTHTNYSYDGNNRMLSMLTNPGSMLNSSFGYDKAGNKLFEKKFHISNKSEQYGYDNSMRLTSFKVGALTGNTIASPIHQSQYNYDLRGNRTSVTTDAQTTNYTSNIMNAYTNLSGAISATMQYDNNGNLVNDGIYIYTYDAQNHLIAVNNGAMSSYKYDALGRRINKKVGSVSTQFFYSAYNEIEYRDSLSNVLSSYVNGLRIDDIVSAQINNNDYYYYKNALGSVNAIANSSGTILERYEYDAFGKVHFYDANYNITSSSSIGNTILFAGRTYDSEIAKYYNRARNYNESTGRFEQRDPKGYFAGDLNLYTYVFNNPVGLIDPFGTDGTHCGDKPKASDRTPDIIDQIGTGTAYEGDLILSPADLISRAAVFVTKAKETKIVAEFVDHFATNPSAGGIVEEFMLRNLKDGIAASEKAAGIAKPIGFLGGLFGAPLAIVSAIGSARTFTDDPTNGHLTDLAVAAAGVASGVVGLAALGGVAAASTPLIGSAGIALAVIGIANTATQLATGHTLGEHIDDGFNAWFDWYYMDLDDEFTGYVPNHCN